MENGSRVIEKRVGKLLHSTVRRCERLNENGYIRTVQYDQQF